MSKSIQRNPTPAPKEKRDRWSAMADALASQHETIAASSPQGMASRLMEGKVTVPETVSAFMGWKEEQRVEFARSLAGSKNIYLKHSVAQEMKRQGNGRQVDPGILRLLDFSAQAETIALGYLENLKGQTPNSIARKLISQYTDRELMGVLASAFREAASLCDDSLKEERKLLEGVAKRLDNPLTLTKDN